MSEYDDPIKDICWQTYWEGYQLGYGVENMKEIDRQTAKSHFERWWSRNA
jgi:hypothetical protein